MKIAVISDIHLGGGGPQDSFGHDDYDFLRFLQFLEANFEKVILLGDIWETLTAPPSAQLYELQIAQGAHPEIAKRFREPPYSYISGNHDLVSEVALGALPDYSLKVDGLRLFFAHGHQGDFWCFKTKKTSEYGVRVGAWLARNGLKTVRKAFTVLEQCRDAGNRGLKSWAASQKADIVVTGHTHIAEKAENGDQLFLNSGHCDQGNLSFLALDTKSLSFGVHRSF